MSTPSLPEVPQPQVLDPDRLIMPEGDDVSAEEHRDRARVVMAELARTCEYGQTLWQQLGAVRTYLSTHVPPEQNDSADWRAWRALYGSVVSAMAGPAGDSGFGDQEATGIAEQHHATAPQA